MDSQFKVWQTAKEAFSLVNHDLKAWMKVLSLPVLIMIITALLGFVGENFGNVSDGLTEEEPTLLEIITTVIGRVGDILATILFAVNGFRYAMYQEGGEKWFQWGFLSIARRVLGYYIVIIFMLLPVVGAGAMAFVFASETDLLGLARVLGGLAVIATLYLCVRLFFVIPFVVIGHEKPIRSSFHDSKNNVMRLTGLYILLKLIFTIPIGLFFMAVGLIAFTEINEFFIIAPSLAMVFIMAYGEAIVMTATILAYKKIAGKSAPAFNGLMSHSL
ncbi:hypothetical protein Bealeia1_01141 [Candidatus Bealeia paramacronuclearis]|uniref:Glycerophosphoryl diester phosphodiesterase membrane domain-containing protein n=1 Tax=Candidatus Bealeia paramacronuclearis TaxID=1921001 RepID=A0ABZ2C5Q2_9PROT|nr:hypothetical protein [Candidatus Bealeia paramacronuclearis]